ncbi:MAG: hypothetical protein LBT04_02915 [Prevotellaceae bacterium]|jgi:hypothetical protein|nr:hypothetical protein [Prevotellaceae bacterium]
MTKTFIDRQQTSLIKKFHVLLGQCGMNNEDKLSFLSAWGVESSKDLSAYELMQACNLLDSHARKGKKTVTSHDADVWRKRVMGATGAYLRMSGMAEHGSNVAYIKSMVCRAAGETDFNKISQGNLQAVYNAFLKKQKAIKEVDKVTAEAMFGIQMLN